RSRADSTCPPRTRGGKRVGRQANYARLSQDRQNRSLRVASRDMHVALPIDEDIDFAADAELGEINPGLDADTGVRQGAALFAGLEAVHIGAVAVDLFTDGVAGAVAEVLAVARFFDRVASRLVYLPALQGALGCEGILNAGDGCVSSSGDNL